MDWTLVSAVNSEEILRSTLLKSPDLQGARNVVLQRGFPSAARAYNDAIAREDSEVFVFTHQDVYLPKGWANQLERAVQELSQRNIPWGVLGVFGIDMKGRARGSVYSTGLNSLVGEELIGVLPVVSLDECVLVLRRSSGLRFDERLMGFHLYGTDICLEAKKIGLPAFVFDGFCIHNSDGYRMLPLSFWRCYFSLWGKWKRELPIKTPCTTITYAGWPIVRWHLERFHMLFLRGWQPGKRVTNPEELAVTAERQLRASGVGVVRA